MKTIRYIEIVLSLYHCQIVGRIRFEHEGELIESSLYSLREINNVLALWRDKALCGSFALGYNLAKDYTFQLVKA